MVQVCSADGELHVFTLLTLRRRGAGTAVGGEGQTLLWEKERAVRWRICSNIAVVREGEGRWGEEEDFKALLLIRLIVEQNRIASKFWVQVYKLRCSVRSVHLTFFTKAGTSPI
jgi:hypothetical protein